MNWKAALAGACLALCFSAAGTWAADSGQKIELKASERMVHVTYFRAPGDAKRPAVLLLHGAGGFDGQSDAYEQYCAALNQAGMDAYLVYYYSPADESDMRRDGDTFGRRYPAWAKLVDDLADGLLKTADSNGKVGLVGFSNGAILASGAAARDDKIAAAVIYYGGAPWVTLGPVNHFPPLLIMHGDADRIIPVREAHMLADFAQQFGAKVDLVIYPGESHGFGSRLATKDGADALARTVTFLTQELDAR